MDLTREISAEPAEHATAGMNGAGSGSAGVGQDDDGFDLSRLLQALQSMRAGDFGVRLPSDCTGLEGKIADTFNEIVAANQCMAQELEQVGQVVGTRGQDPHACQARADQPAPGARWKPRSIR